MIPLSFNFILFFNKFSHNVFFFMIQYLHSNSIILRIFYLISLLPLFSFLIFLFFFIFPNLHHFLHLVCHFLMQPSMGTLNSPSSRVVKDSTPSPRRILRYINFGIGGSSPILILDMMNLHLILFEAW